MSVITIDEFKDIVNNEYYERRFVSDKTISSAAFCEEVDIHCDNVVFHSCVFSRKFGRYFKNCKFIDCKFESVNIDESIFVNPIFINCNIQQIKIGSAIFSYPPEEGEDAYLYQKIDSKIRPVSFHFLKNVGIYYNENVYLSNGYTDGYHIDYLIRLLDEEKNPFHLPEEVADVYRLMLKTIKGIYSCKNETLS